MFVRAVIATCPYLYPSAIVSYTMYTSQSHAWEALPGAANGKRVRCMALQMKIGSRIRALRKSQYPMLSIHRLAVMAEVDPGQLSRAERGMAGLSLEALERIAEALNVSLGTLVDPEGQSSRTGAAEPEAVRPYNEYYRLIHGFTRLVWAKLPEDELVRCSDAEQALIRHHIHSAIEEGVKRGHLLAEREIKALRKSKKGNESDPS